MKYLYIVILAVLIYVFIPQPLDEERHLFILSGQSNMDGLIKDLHFTLWVRDAFGYDSVIVVKDSQGGMPIRRWYNAAKAGHEGQQKSVGDLYNRLMNKVKAETKGKHYTTATLIWMQGEQDAIEKNGETYAASMRGLINLLAKGLECEKINFVIGRISDTDVDNKISPHWTMVRKAQVAVAESDPHGAWVNTDDLNDGINSRGIQIKNDLHYSAEGYKLLGKRFAEKSIALIRRNVNQCR